MLRPKQEFLAVVLFPLLILSSWPALAQRRPVPPRRAPAPAVVEPVVSFDTLLADEQYRIYSEVRNVGTLIRSEGFNDLLEPLVQFAEPPEQFSTVLNWMRSHGDLLAGSRLCIATWPSRNTLPQFVLAVELASPADAKKLEADLRGFLPKLDPKPQPTPSPSPQAPTPNTELPASPAGIARLQTQQVGALVLLSEKKISLPELKPARRRLLAESPNFVMARSRFASEPIFVYVDFKSIEKEELKRRRQWEEEARKQEELAAANPTPEPSPETGLEAQLANLPENETEVLAPPEAPTENGPVAIGQTNAEAQMATSMGLALHPLSMALFGGSAKYPEALSLALAFEGDSYTLRALLVNSPENRSLPVPFFPQLASGPVLTPASPGILPGEAELFVVLSLDYAQMHDAMVKAFADQPWIYVSSPNPMKRPASPFSVFEEKAGLKVKEDLLPLLANEIAFILTKPPAAETSSREATSPGNDDLRSVHLPELRPVIAVAMKDREAVKKVIPKMIESMGMKGAATLAQTEKRGDAEIISYANLFAYAFVGDFLIFSPDPALTRRAVDSYLASDTLSSNTRYRNATRWQGRQIQGQAFLTADLIERYLFAGKDRPPPTTPANQPLEPLTYMLSNDGVGPIHEAHIPRSLVQMVVAGLTTKSNESPIFTNESIARNVLRTIAESQETFRKTKGKGSYGSIDELVTEGLIPKDLTEKYGYRIELSVISNRFEIRATPLEYGKSGKRSFFIDESGVLRGGDHGGGAATLSDKQINE